MGTSKSPREKFREWFDGSGLTKADVGRVLDCTPEHVAYILEGKRVPGLRIAFRIEEASGGAVSAREWAEAEAA